MDTNLVVGIVIDLIAGLVILSALLVGVKKGFVNQLRGLVATIIIIVIATFCVGPLTNFVTPKTNIDDKISLALANPLSGAIELENSGQISLYYVVNESENSLGEKVIGLVWDDNGERRPFSTLVEKHAKDASMINKNIYEVVLNNIVAPRAELALKAEAEANESASSGAEKSLFVIDVLSDTITYYIFCAVFFIILSIIFQILWFSLYKLLKKAISHLYVAHFLNKALGVVVGAVIGFLVVLIINTVLLVLTNLFGVDVIATGLENTYIMKQISEINFIYQAIASSGMLALPQT
ncbi:MAG: hypothetical protein FWD49_00590 [Firmicutes bacterium]|nr:hypothetical protein [Bacillota bacterium]